MKVLYLLRTCALVCLLPLPALAQSTVTVTGTVKAGNTTALANARVKFDLLYCGPNQAHVPGVAQLPQTSFELKPNGSGSISATIFGNDVIACGGLTGNSRWRVTYIVNGTAGVPCDYNITTDNSPFDLSTQQCINVVPVPTAPTAESTYLRLDGGNGTLSTGNYVRSLITGIDAALVVSGTFDVLRIPNLDAGKITSGTFNVLRIPDLSATYQPKLTLPLAKAQGGTGNTTGDADTVDGNHAAAFLLSAKVKAQRFGATCTTMASFGNTCTTTYSWTTPFADANYTPVCTAYNGANNPVWWLQSFDASGVTILVETVANAASGYAGFHCFALHD